MSEFLKLEIFIPESHREELEKALGKTDAGHIGNYDCCLSYSYVMSTWRPLPGTKPYSGNTGEISREQEVKVEVTIFREQLKSVMDAICQIHPYEEPVVNVIPLYYTMRDFLKEDKK
jgi:hypothetical protein